MSALFVLALDSSGVLSSDDLNLGLVVTSTCLSTVKTYGTLFEQDDYTGLCISNFPYAYNFYNAIPRASSPLCLYFRHPLYSLIEPGRKFDQIFFARLTFPCARSRVLM